MFKRTIGIGLLVCVLFFGILVLVPVKIEPVALKHFNETPQELSSAISNLKLFAKWDPKGVTDTTVTYKLNAVENKLNVLDSTLNILVSYTVLKQNSEEVEINIHFKSGQNYNYNFALTPKANGTEVKWTMSMKGNLMIALFDAEDKLSALFDKGLSNFQTIIANRP